MLPLLVPSVLYCRPLLACLLLHDRRTHGPVRARQPQEWVSLPPAGRDRDGEERRVEVKIGYPLVARGSLVGWEYERQAERAVAEEEGEIARMQAELGGRDHQLQLAEVAVPQEQERLSMLMSVPDEVANIDLLARDRVELLAKVMQQAEQLRQSRAELESVRRSAAIAKGVMVDIVGSRGYCFMRLLGRWRAIERGIQRALRES